MMIPPRIRMYTGDACAFCSRAKAFLTKKGVPFEEIHIDRFDPLARQRLVELTGRYTVPQIVVDEEPIGGYDELRALDAAGRLDPMLGLA